MSSLIIPRYQFDPTGQAPSNLILDEQHSVPQNGHRLIVAREGLFYTPGLIIRPANNPNHLVEGQDYQFTSNDPDITALTGIETATAIELINPQQWGDFVISYHAVGGHEGRSNALIKMLIDAIENTKNLPIDWTAIRNKPSQYPPEEHFHEMRDITGWEVMVQGLRELQRAIVESRPLHLSSRDLHNQDQRILYILCQLKHDLNRISDYMGRYDSIITRLLLEVERLSDLPQRVADLEARVQRLEDVDHETMILTLIERWHILNGCGNGQGSWVPTAGDIIDMYLVDRIPVAGPGEMTLPFIVDCAGGSDAPATDTGGTTEKPVITTPTDGTQWVNQTPTFIGSPFSGVDGSGDPTTHIASFWQIATDPQFTQIRYMSGRTTTHLTELRPASVGLTLTSGTYYVRVGYVSSSESTSPWSDMAMFSITIQEVEAPDITQPANGDIDISLRPTFMGSDFAAVGGGGHSNSQWQVAKDSQFSQVVVDTTTSEHLTQISLDVSLDPSTEHHVRVRYRSSNNSWSAWSQPVSFTTAAPATIPAPTLSYVNDRGIDYGFELSSTDYVPNAGQPSDLLEAQWQVSTTDTFGSFVVDTAKPGDSNYVQFLGAGDHEAVHYARVRYVNDVGAVSEWSNIVSFDCLLQPLAVSLQTITVNRYDSIEVDGNVYSGSQLDLDALVIAGRVAFSRAVPDSQIDSVRVEARMIYANSGLIDQPNYYETRVSTSQDGKDFSLEVPYLMGLIDTDDRYLDVYVKVYISVTLTDGSVLSIPTTGTLTALQTGGHMVVT